MISPPVWIGVDPGGTKNFGVAIWVEGEAPQTWCVDCAEDAAQLVGRHMAGGMPSGVGVDAPLWWSAGRSSDRRADRWLRTTFKLGGGAVQTANSLQGAALVQAVMFIVRLRAITGALVPVTEAHPKALLRVEANNDWKVFANRYGISAAMPSEHERDAVIGAIAAREGFSGRWPLDLSLTRLPEEQDPKAYWLAPIHYFWPFDRQQIERLGG